MKAICATDLSAASEATIENETCPRVSRPNRRRGDSPRDRDPVERPRGYARDRFRRATRAGARALPSRHRRRRLRRRSTRRSRDAPSTHQRDRRGGRRQPYRRRLAGKEPAREPRHRLDRAQPRADDGRPAAAVNRIERGADEPAVVREHLFRRMLYATDFSENAERAFEAFSYLRHATREATLVHVETPKDPGLPEDANPEARLAELATQLENWGSRREQRSVREIQRTRSSPLKTSTSRRRSSSARAGTAGSADCCSGASPKTSSHGRTETSCSFHRTEWPDAGRGPDPANQ